MALLVGAGAALHDGVDVGDLFAAVEAVQDGFDAFEQLVQQVADGDLLFDAEVEQFSLQTVAHGAPFVLGDEGAVVKAEGHVAMAQVHHPGDGCLDQCGDGEHVVDVGQGVADTNLKRGLFRCRPF